MPLIAKETSGGRVTENRSSELASWKLYGLLLFLCRTWLPDEPNQSFDTNCLSAYQKNVSCQLVRWICAFERQRNSLWLPWRRLVSDLACLPSQLEIILSPAVFMPDLIAWWTNDKSVFWHKLLHSLKRFVYFVILWILKYNSKRRKIGEVAASSLVSKLHNQTQYQTL